MFGKFVGIDLDSSKIKVCVIDRKFRRTELQRLYEIDRSSDSETISDLLFDKLNQESVKTDVSVSIPSSPVSLRVLSFPFKDMNKIDQVYNFELENVSTLNVEDKTHSYHLIEGRDGADALVCMFKKDEIRNIINMFEQGGVNPRVVTFSPFALDVLSDSLDLPRPFLLVSIGQFTTNFILFTENGVSRVRSSGFGLESAISKYSSISNRSYGEAQNSVRRGFIDSEDKNMYQSFSPLFGEIKKTIKFFEFNLKRSIEKIMLSGEVALLPGMVSAVEIETKRQVSLVSIPELGGNSASYLNSYALALYGSRMGKGKLNFRKEEFLFRSQDEELKKAFLIPALLFCLLIFMMLFRNGISYVRLSSRANALEKQIKSNVRDIFPEVKVIPKPVDFMQSQVSKIGQELDLVKGIESGKTPLDIIRNISLSIPRKPRVILNEIGFIDDLSLRLKGTSKSYDGIARVEQSLTDSGFFQNVIRQSTGSGVNKIKFELSLEVK